MPAKHGQGEERDAKALEGKEELVGNGTEPGIVVVCDVRLLNCSLDRGDIGASGLDGSWQSQWAPKGGHLPAFVCVHHVPSDAAAKHLGRVLKGEHQVTS